MSLWRSRDRWNKENLYVNAYKDGSRQVCKRIIKRLKASALGAKDSKDLSKYSAYSQAIEIVKEEMEK